jgi:hypothetical protein
MHVHSSLISVVLHE